MKNFEFEIQGNQLLIKVDLSKEFGLSKSGRSVIVSSSEGNLRLFDEKGFRNEIVNLSVTRKATEADRT